jgi:cysteine-rich repeat protein
MKTLRTTALGALLLLSTGCSFTLDPESVDPPAGDGGGGGADTAGPVVALTTKPAVSTTSTTADFAFTATDASPPVTFTCQLDVTSATGCTGTASYSALSLGNHTFTLVATDGLGNSSTTAFTWTVTSSGSGCGNGTLEPLEGCDDGGIISGDGCSSTCQYELGYYPPLASIAVNGFWMSVTPSGIIYASVSGSGSGDSITRVDGAGAVTLNAIPGIKTQYGGDVIAVGEDVVFGGSNASTWTTYIQRWDHTTNTTSDLFSIGGAYYYFFAVNADFTRMFYGDSSILKVTAGSAAPFSPTPPDRLLYDQLRNKLYVLSSGVVSVDATGGAGASGNFTTFFSHANIHDMAIDGAGRVYLACTIIDFMAPSYTPCADGSVLAVDPTGTTFKSFVTGTTAVRRLGFDASRNSLVVGSFEWPSKIYRIPVAP